MASIYAIDFRFWLLASNEDHHFRLRQGHPSKSQDETPTLSAPAMHQPAPAPSDVLWPVIQNNALKYTVI